MSNEVEIIISSKNRARAGIEAAKRDVTGLGGTFQKLNATITQSMTQARTSITEGISDATRDTQRDVAGLAAGLKQTLGQAGQDAGTALGEGIVKGAEGRMRDAKGRFIKAAIPAEEADREGRSIGSRIMSGIKGAISAGAGAVASGLSGAFEAASAVAGPVLIGSLVAVVAAAAPMMGAVLGGGLVMGIGAGFVGLGAMLLLQNDKIKKSFAATGKEIQQIMTDASKPLLPAMEHAMAGVKRLVQEFNPIFKQVFSDAEIPLKNFIDSFLGGLQKLAPAVAPIMTAFTGLANAIDWDGLFESVSAALVDLATTVVANQSTIATLFDGLLAVLPLVISGITGLITLLSTMRGIAASSSVAMSQAFVGLNDVLLGVAETVLVVFRTIGEAISSVPGMEKIGQAIVAGIDQALVKVGEWKTAAQEASTALQLKAEISDLTAKIDQAKALLLDPELSKERIAKINADIAALVQRKGEAIAALGDPKLIAEYKSSIVTEIAALKSRLAEARRELQSPELTKERKSKLNADIASLQAAVRQAQAALNSLRDKTITITTIYETNRRTADARGTAQGGIIGGSGAAMAQGGVSGARNSGSSMTLVGEQGPELVRLPFGSQVTSAGQTRAALAGGGGGGPIVLEIRSGGSRLDDLLVEILRRAVRVRGGNVQIVLGKE